MTVDPKLVLWLAAAFMAVISLAQLMRNRQNGLSLKLRKYVGEQHQWSKKRAKAARLARTLAREKAESEANKTRTPDDPNLDRYDKYASSATAVGTPQGQPADSR